MKDPRIEKLAKNLLTHSVRLQKGERILIEIEDEGFDLAEQLVKEAYAMGAKNHSFYYRSTRMWRTIFSGADESLLTEMVEHDLDLIKKVDARILICRRSQLC